MGINTVATWLYSPVFEFTSLFDFIFGLIVTLGAAILFSQIVPDPSSGSRIRFWNVSPNNLGQAQLNAAFGL
ncbi:unnamed protein product [Mycena citricolor]|uniref:Uncharacterized protein n=1 Tax=Mycena citricolor TaxID=2018698 RepID=A0AAD2HC45_9AGAR|nr:unnamed protein product [Mycena citricolor]